MPTIREHAAADPPALDDVAVMKLRMRLERLARTLLGKGRLGSAEGLWQFQLDLLGLQREIQSAIATTKRMPRNGEARFITLTHLRTIRWHSRQLGDAFAWILLGLDRQTIGPLADNDRVSIPTDDHTSTSVQVVATHLSKEGWGFPVLHDITDCLRIGDLTFIKVGDDNSRKISTIEVKTSVKDEGGGAFQYSVTLISPVPFGPDAKHTVDEIPKISGAATSGQLPKRVDRQVKRMRNAVIRQRAVSGELIEMDGEPPLLSVRARSSSGSHWKILRRLIRSARLNGYASEVVDGAFLYSALYSESGVTESDLTNSLLDKDLIASGLLRTEPSVRRAIVVSAMPPSERRAAHRYLPYFLYSIPNRAIYDLLHGRLILIVLYNPYRIADILKANDLEVAEATDAAGYKGKLSLVIKLQTEEGAYRAELPSLDGLIDETVYEFKSIGYAIDLARASHLAAVEGLSKQISAHSDEVPDS